jgi:transcriptional regulator NrdR family protein
MSFQLKCPYCDAEVTPSEDCREQETNIEKQCDVCERTFLYQIVYMPNYTAWQAPCLNGQAHDYRPIVGAPAEYYRRRRRCFHCADEVVLAGSEKGVPA